MTRIGSGPAATLAALTLQLWFLPSPGAADSPTLGGPFNLVDQDGAPRTEADFLGSYPLIYFGFTRCPDLCPRSLGTTSQAIDDLAARAPGQAERVVPILVTVDPRRDDVAAMKDYVARFHPRLVGLTGSPEEIERMVKNYGAFYAPVPDGGDYAMDHSGFIVLMGPAGEYLAHVEPNVPTVEIVEKLEREVAP